MSHHLTRELVPFDIWNVTQNGREPGEKETNMLGSFGGIAKCLSVLECLLQFFLCGLCVCDQEFHSAETFFLRFFLVVVSFGSRPGFWRHAPRGFFSCCHERKRRWIGVQ